MEVALFIVQTVTLVVLSLTALFILRQAQEANAVRRLDAMLRVHDLMSCTDARRDRRCLYSTYETHKGDIPLELTDEDRERIERICVESDIIGGLVKRGLVPKNDLLEGHYDVVIKTWKAAKTFVARKRRSGTYAHYVELFEELCRQAEDYRRTNQLPEPMLPYEVAAIGIGPRLTTEPSQTTTHTGP